MKYAVDPRKSTQARLSRMERSRHLRRVKENEKSGSSIYIIYLNSSINGEALCLLLIVAVVMRFIPGVADYSRSLLFLASSGVLALAHIQLYIYASSPLPVRQALDAIVSVLPSHYLVPPVRIGLSNLLPSLRRISMICIRHS